MSEVHPQHIQQADDTQSLGGSMANHADPWPPPFSYVNADHPAYTNWGQAVSQSGNQLGEPITDADLVRASLASSDIALIQSLHLAPNHGSKKRTDFLALVAALPRVLTDRPILGAPVGFSPFAPTAGAQWLRELLAGFIPPRPDDRMGSDPLTQLYGEAAPLMVLHLLLLRSNYWPYRIKRCTRVDLSDYLDDWGLPGAQNATQQFNQLVGDPANLPSELEDGGWSDTTFACRRRTLWHGSPAVRPFLKNLDLLVHAAAAVHPGLQAYLAAYDRWLAGQSAL